MSGWVGSDAVKNYNYTKLVKLFNETVEDSSKSAKDYFEAVLTSTWALLSKKEMAEIKQEQWDLIHESC